MYKFVCFIQCFISLSFFCYAEAINPNVVEPQSFVLFGATGDLTQRKLIPALFNLEKEGRLPENFAFVGVARRDKSQEEFRQDIFIALLNSSLLNSEECEIWKCFLTKCFYCQLDFTQDCDYLKLQKFMEQIDDQCGTSGNRLYYLATQPSFFSTIIESLSRHQLIEKSCLEKSPWKKVLIEKPFGHDLSSSIELRDKISHHLSDNEIYCIDHYLGKEVVQNILPLRFANSLFESIWNAQFIDHVEIVISEDIGIESRGHCWEETGMLRDIVQNHLLQLLALVAMEPPQSFDSKVISDQKTRLLNSIRPLLEDAIDSRVVRGQYGPGIIDGKKIMGYREENDVSPNSNVETYVAAKLYIDNARWQDVPFYLSAGKRLTKRFAHIIVTFKENTDLALDLGGQHWPNRLVIRIQADPEIYLEFCAKEQGFDGEIKTFKLQFHYETVFGHQPMEAYERLLYHAMRGDGKHFVGFNEILASWLFVNPILKYWKMHPPLDFPNYIPGSSGPEAAKGL